MQMRVDYILCDIPFHVLHAKSVTQQVSELLDDNEVFTEIW